MCTLECIHPASRLATPGNILNKDVFVAKINLLVVRRLRPASAESANAGENSETGIADCNAGEYSTPEWNGFSEINFVHPTHYGYASRSPVLSAG